MLISFENLKTPSKDEYKSGVKTLTYEYKRQNPKAKSTSFLQNVEKIRIQMGNKDINEILLHDETGYILEGLSSNFFAVKNGVLYTSERDILLGIIRSIVLRCAQNLGVKIVFEPIKISEINEIEEAFITSASRGILPVSIINDETIANGLPGRITKSLMRCYEKTILEELEHI